MRNVLLVEDNPDDRLHIAGMIRDACLNIDVHAVDTGEEAIQYFKEHEPHCSIVDYRLEVEDGLDILKEMKEISPCLPVIMMTGQGDEDLAATSIKEGAADYLIKQNLTELHLKSSIENAISRSLLEKKIAEQDDERKNFLNILVHDLRAPLRYIQHLSENAIEDAANGEYDEMTKALKTQNKMAERASNFISTLESYALLDGDVTYNKVSLVKIVEQAKENLEGSISEKHGQVVIGQLPVVTAHEPQLIQLFQNLIQNGLKYNESTQPTITIEQKDNGIVVVRDNGIGIPEIQLERVFDPLKRLWSMEKYEGTGLGLATCQKIMARHKGKIWCTSTEGCGSEFHVRFPAVQFIDSCATHP